MMLAKKAKLKEKTAPPTGALSHKIDLNTQRLHEVKRTQNEIQQIVSDASSDELRLKLSHFLKLLLNTAGDISDPPINYFISRASYEGSSLEDACNLSITLEITVLTDHWTRVPLFADTLALLSSSIKYKQIFDNMDNQNNDNSKHIGASAEELTSLGVVNGAYTMLAYNSGSYLVQLELLVPYQTTRKTGFQILVPKASQNDIRFKISAKDILIKVDPALFSKQFYEDNLSSVESRFPPTRTLSVQWTENLGNLEKKDEKVEINSTAEQKILISIGEGVITFTNKISFYIVSGQMSLFEIEIDPRVKILSVEGPKQKPVKRWEAKQTGKQNILKVWLEYGVEDSYTFTVTSELEMKSKSDSVEIPTFSCLATKEVSREKGMIAIEARTNVEVEEIKCSGLGSLGVNEISEDLFSMSSDSVLLGYKYLYPNYKLAINIKKHADVGVLIAIIDAASFCTTITPQGQFLHRLVLDVRNTQKQFVRITLPHESFEIWSSTVAGTLVKPARDEKGNVMIPLIKTSKLDETQSSSYNVVLVYITKNEPLKENGNLNIKMGYTDIPVNKVYVEVYVPANFKCKEWSGMKEVEYWSGTVPSAEAQPQQQYYGGRAQQRFRGHKEMDKKMEQKDMKKSRKNGRRKHDLQAKMDMDYGGMPVLYEQTEQLQRTFSMDSIESYEDDDDEIEMDEKEQQIDSPQASKSNLLIKNTNNNNNEDAENLAGLSSMFGGTRGGGGKTVGVIPVKVDIPQVGRSYKFEQLLVSHKVLEVKTEYHKKEKGSCEKRSVDSACTIV